MTSVFLDFVPLGVTVLLDVYSFMASKALKNLSQLIIIAEIYYMNKNKNVACCVLIYNSKVCWILRVKLISRTSHMF